MSGINFWKLACAALCVSSLAHADYLEMQVFGQVTSGVRLKFWQYTGYFDLDAPVNMDEPTPVFESVYGFGGRMQSPNGTPFYTYRDFYTDEVPSTMTLRYFEGGSTIGVVCSNDLGVSTQLIVESVAPTFWDPFPMTLPRDLDAYRVVPRQGGDEFDMYITLLVAGHNIRWEPNGSGHDYEQGPIFYTVRIVEELPASAYDPIDFNRDGEINFYDVSRFIELYLNATN